MMRFGLCFFFSIALCNNEWVGYESTIYPRTRGLQGIIDKNFIKQYLPENPVIVEAGAYHGSDTVDMATQWPHALIYSFEPVPHLYEQLVEKSRNFKNIHTFQIALSNKTGTAEFYISSGQSIGGSSSLLRPKEHLKDHPDIIFRDCIRVNTTTLDSWAAQHNIEKIDFLWLDMQGAEALMLRASSKIIKTVKVILTEVNITEQYENCELYVSYKNWLNSIGFEVVREDLPWKNGGNVLFVRK